MNINKIKYITIKQAIMWGYYKLKTSNIANSKNEAILLIAYTINSSYLNIITKYQQILNKNQIIKFINIIKRRSKNEPFAYITEHKEFMGFNFFVNKSVLIPRPDTETLVKYALKAMPNKTIKYRCLDVCTGSGCIAISLALMRPNIVIDAIDNSKPALKVLKYNIKYFNLEHRIRSIHNNLLYSYIINKKLNLIIANPPYLTQKEYNSLTPNIKNYEPKQALVNNKYDPLLVHKILIRDSYAYLLNKGILILEFGYNQKNKLIKIHRGKFKKPKFFTDYSRIPRVCIFQK